MQIPARWTELLNCFMFPVQQFCPKTMISIIICSVCLLSQLLQTDGRLWNLNGGVTFENSGCACPKSSVVFHLAAWWTDWSRPLRFHAFIFSGLCQGPVWCVGYGPVPTKTGLVWKLLSSLISQPNALSSLKTQKNSSEIMKIKAL